MQPQAKTSKELSKYIAANNKLFAFCNVFGNAEEKAEKKKLILQELQNYPIDAVEKAIPAITKNHKDLPSWAEILAEISKHLTKPQPSILISADGYDWQAAEDVYAQTGNPVRFIMWTRYLKFTGVDGDVAKFTATRMPQRAVRGIESKPMKTSLTMKFIEEDPTMLRALTKIAGAKSAQIDVG